MSAEAGFAERTVNVEGLALRLVDAGHGAPVLVLTGGARFAGAPAQALLAAKFRTIAVEPDAPVKPERLAAAVAMLAETLGLATFGVAGMLDAAEAAARTAAGPRGRVDALVLVSPRGLVGAGAPAGGEFAENELLRTLAESGVPALVLTGTRDTAQARATGSRLVAALPRAHAAIVYAAGADIAADRPEAFVEVAADFLERKDQFITAQDNPVFAP